MYCVDGGAAPSRSTHAWQAETVANWPTGYSSIDRSTLSRSRALTTHAFTFCWQTVCVVPGNPDGFRPARGAPRT